MPSAVAPNLRVDDTDDLDDLFNYEAGPDNANSEDRETRTTDRAQQPQLTTNIDEEIKVTRKRAPVAKLDEARYVSAPSGQIQR